MNTSKLFLMVTLVLALFMIVPATAFVPTSLTGDVENDFPDVSGVLILTDPGGPNEINVTWNEGYPNEETHNSGWDIKDIRLAYDEGSDTLYVGVNSFGIVGDVDGNGDPNTVNDPNFNDVANLCSGESVAVYFDLDMFPPNPFNNDFSWDVIAGVGNGFCVGGYLVASFDKGAFSPPNNFGVPLTPPAAPVNHIGTTSHSPDPTHPDFEFTILHFSQLANSLPIADPAQYAGFTDPMGLTEFRVGAYMGSPTDGDIGEDFVYYHQFPSTEVTVTPSDLAVIDGGTVNLTVTEENNSPGAAIGQLNGPTTATPIALSFENVQVDLTMNGSPYITLTSPADSGDTSDSGVLNMGEIWQWTIPSVSITESTEFVATAKGTDPLGFVHTFTDDPNMPGDPNEQAVVDVNVLSTDVGISAEPNAVECNEPFDLIVTELNDGDAPLTDVNVVVTRNDGGPAIPALLAPPDSGDTLANNILDPGEEWVWTIPGLTIGQTTTFTATGSADFNGITVDDSNDFDEQASVEVTWDCGEPNTVLDISASDTLVCEGDTVTLTVCEENTGNVPLHNVFVDVYDGTLDETLVYPPDEFRVGNTDDVLEPNEVWCWDVNVVVDANTTYYGEGYGYDPQDNLITYQTGYTQELDDVTVETEPCGGEGCTPGFWKNNAKNWGANAWCEDFDPGDLFYEVFELPGPVVLNANGKKIYSNPTLLEALDANGGGINALARHAVAALLNTCSECVDYAYSDVGALIADVHDAIVSGDANAIQALHEELAYYNEAGCPVNQHGECSHPID